MVLLLNDNLNGPNRMIRFCFSMQKEMHNKIVNVLFVIIIAVFALNNIIRINAINYVKFAIIQFNVYNIYVYAVNALSFFFNEFKDIHSYINI